MKIGIIGAGHIGGTAAKLFVDAGNEVAIANSRGPETLQEVVATLGDNAHAATIEEAAAFGEVVLVAIPLGKYQTLPIAPLNGKIVVDANNYYPSRDGQIAALDEGATTSSELLAEHLSGAHVVKGFNTIWSEHLKTKGDNNLPSGERFAIYIAGDDTDAKATVTDLIESIGFGVVDTGTLHEGGKRQQPGAYVYGKELTAAEAKQHFDGANE